MKIAGVIGLGLAVLLGTLLKPDLPRPDLAPGHGHDHAEGVVHANPDDPEHRHGDSDDHHDTPNTPCHHHDTHACDGHGSIHLMTADCAPVNPINWQRFVSPDLFASSAVTPKKLLHVPLA